MTAPQLKVLVGNSWRLADILGVGYDGEIRAVDTLAVQEPTTPADLFFDFDSEIFPSQLNVHPGATIGTGYAHSGAYGCRLTPAPTTGICSLTCSGANFPSGKPWVSFSMWFRLITSPGSNESYMNLFELGNALTEAPKSQFTVFFNKGKLMMDFNAGETQQIADTPALGGWHKIESRVNFGDTTYSAQVRFDGGSPINFSSAADKIATTASVMWIHYPSGAGVDYISDYDEIKISTSDSDPGWLT